MLIAYIACLIIGGAFVVMSILFGGKDADADTDADADADADATFEIDHELDVDHDLDADADADLDVDHDADADAAFDAHHEVDTGGAGPISTDGTLWLPFLSFKFWTFLLTGFGLVGTVLTLLGVGTGLTLGLSIAVGLIAGLAVGYALHRLKQQTVDSTTRLHDYIGQTARVLIPPRNGEPGEIQLEMRGQKINLIATTDEDFSFERGDEVFIFRCNDEGIAEVVHPARVMWRDGRRPKKHQTHTQQARAKAEVRG